MSSTDNVSERPDWEESSFILKEQPLQNSISTPNITTESNNVKKETPSSPTKNTSPIASGLGTEEVSLQSIDEDIPDAGSAVKVVASHYNALEETGLKERMKSRIYFMRNFNNWVKSMLIGEYLKQTKGVSVLGQAVRVLDLGCGKGGDLLKWQRGNVSHVVCADVASVSVEQCERRFKDMQHGARSFTAEFITADCTKVRLREHYKDPSIQFDLVSCQFAFHYCFESLAQADCMMRNAAECLRPGGFFIGTIPNAYEIVKRLKESQNDSFGNDIYRINMLNSATGFPLFGAMYDFHLEGVVDCPEFLVHFPTLVKLAESHGLELINKNSFHNIYLKNSDEGKHLLQKIQGLETYPPHENSCLLGEDPVDYQHAIKHRESQSSSKFIGTLSSPEWEAISLYIAFAFKKTKLDFMDYPEEPKDKKRSSRGGESSCKRKK